ncbi:DUF4232 domain-containing protein [Frondihabitans australicus]|uniref:Uncharacterized protein DUF4232 n=1 Tax=Frondihabitans australicus TaxID=386892 RepID=A0A495IID4_9MICO|nr:DUF4232 domain-containing protein [Frondihabitans australicus]RKR75744.1 uncharacterized protein DUF4232 [Frondihabitans australicus]
MRTTTKITVAALALVTALGLAGCAGGKTASEPTATTTITQSPQPSPTPTDTSSSAPTTGTGGGGTGTGTTAACATANLTGALQADPNGGSAGHEYLDLVLTNHGASCTLQGWPGTSFVGTSGNQLGAAATFVTDSPHDTVTLATGGTAKATISIAQAGNYGSSCTKSAAKGFRIYPPGQTASLFADGSKFSLTACTQSSIKLLTVTALQ